MKVITETSLSISEMAEQFDISAYTLRYYEKIGLLNVPRNDHQIRYYPDDVCQTVNAIVNYRKAGLTIAEIHHILDNPDHDAELIQTLLDTKATLQKQVADLENTLSFLETKIVYHRNRLK
ncbi:MerR family transcriptional regulator [Furfurilactobacillus siliginis]|uniref:MerR family transcriptional regulator n=1 Tax=Furfurilactobacillus siliginis TaxID=348151 RepID=A0A0R2LAL1_9LACO|nr:MerR family transcriptional regulator [Furfurilactobacillus siliginis]KRN96332.1 hypothetical protein IV55_GL001293 [Furfurilactobacillus siliginis]GEK29337.1 MerR family transcriptional regulator [Furfurilactobacillus siliginis]